VPRPSYPLFDHLTTLDGVVASPYSLDYHGRWAVDLESVERSWTSRTRALLVVSPNNPTGSSVRREELRELAAACIERDAALIGDEVFADYMWSGATADTGHVIREERALTFSLGGLSKTVGLPQVKLGWIAIGGPDRTVEDARARLELAADTYLSVSTPVQLAAEALFAGGAVVRSQIQARLAGNLETLAARAARTPSCQVLSADGGWSVVIQVPSFHSEEDLVLALLEEHDVVVHPGYFFDFPRESYLVVSLLGRPEEFAEGVSRVFARFDRGAP
jgi:aspartate/methionine/tyrosine aminotransferase